MPTRAAQKRPLVQLVADGVAGPAFAVAARIAALDRRSRARRGGTVKPSKKPFARERHEVLHRQRRIEHGELDLNRAAIGLDVHLRSKPAASSRRGARTPIRAAASAPAESAGGIARRDRAASAALPRARAPPSPCRQAPRSASASPRRRRISRARQRRARGRHTSRRARPQPIGLGQQRRPRRRLELRRGRRAAAARTTASSVFSRSHQDGDRVGRAQLDAATRAPLGRPADRNRSSIARSRGRPTSGGSVPRTVASAARTLQCGSGSSPDSTVMKFSGSSCASERIAAARTGGLGSPSRSSSRSMTPSPLMLPSGGHRLEAQRADRPSWRLNELDEQRGRRAGSPMRPSARIASIATRAIRSLDDERQEQRHGRAVLQRAESLDGKRARIRMRIRQRASTARAARADLRGVAARTPPATSARAAAPPIEHGGGELRRTPSSRTSANIASRNAAAGVSRIASRVVAGGCGQRSGLTICRGHLRRSRPPRLDRRSGRAPRPRCPARAARDRRSAAISGSRARASPIRPSANAAICRTSGSGRRAAPTSGGTPSEGRRGRRPARRGGGCAPRSSPAAGRDRRRRRRWRRRRHDAGRLSLAGGGGGAAAAAPDRAARADPRAAGSTTSSLRTGR